MKRGLTIVATVAAMGLSLGQASAQLPATGYFDYYRNESNELMARMSADMYRRFATQGLRANQPAGTPAPGGSRLLGSKGLYVGTLMGYADYQGGRLYLVRLAGPYPVRQAGNAGNANAGRAANIPNNVPQRTAATSVIIEYWRPKGAGPSVTPTQVVFDNPVRADGRVDPTDQATYDNGRKQLSQKFEFVSSEIRRK